MQDAATRPPEEFALVVNPGGSKHAAWRAEQDAILSEDGLARARAVITSWPGYAPTPLTALPGLAADLGVEALHYKDEAARFGLGSFKALGGAYAVARLLQAELGARLGRDVTMDEIIGRTCPEVAQITVCCATDGNHGRSVAWGAQRFGCACVIFIHATVSDGRRDAIAQYGAEVRRTPGNYDDSVRAAQETATKEGWFVVSDTSYPGYTDIPRNVMQGYELMADEAFAALDEPPTHIFLQTGVGGMAAAVTARAKRLWGDARPTVVLADPAQAACWVDSFRAAAPVAVNGALDTVMAGLACGEVSVLAWEILRTHADAAMAVPDAAALAWMRRLALPGNADPALVAGESAVAGLAALEAALDRPDWTQELGLDAQSRVLIFGTEGDTDPELYMDIVGQSAEAVRGA